MNLILTLIIFSQNGFIGLEFGIGRADGYYQGDWKILSLRDKIKFLNLKLKGKNVFYSTDNLRLLYGGELKLASYSFGSSTSGFFPQYFKPSINIYSEFLDLTLEYQLDLGERFFVYDVSNSDFQDAVYVSIKRKINYKNFKIISELGYIYTIIKRLKEPTLILTPDGFKYAWSYDNGDYIFFILKIHSFFRKFIWGIGFVGWYKTDAFYENYKMPETWSFSFSFYPFISWKIPNKNLKVNLKMALEEEYIYQGISLKGRFAPFTWLIFTMEAVYEF